MKVKCQICKQYFPKAEIAYSLPLGNICSKACLKNQKRPSPTKIKEYDPEIRKTNRGCEARVSKRCVNKGEHVHHRQPRSAGGKDTRMNLVVICGYCHGCIHQHPEQAYKTGWLVKSWQDPAEIKPIRGLWRIND